MNNLYRSLAVFVVLVFYAVAAHAEIYIEDNRVILPALGAGINLGDIMQPASENQTGHAIELRLANAGGSGSQSIARNQNPIILNNTIFMGPQQLRNDFNLNFVQLSWRWRKFFRESSLGLEVLGGIGYTSLGLTVTSPTQRASGSLESSGPQAGVGLIWRTSSGASILAQVAGFSTGEFMHGSPPGVNGMARGEILYAHALDKNLTLRAGYAKWSLYGHGSGMSDFQLRFSGLAVVLDWDFNYKNRAKGEDVKEPD